MLYVTFTAAHDNLNPNQIRACVMPGAPPKTVGDLCALCEGIRSKMRAEMIGCADGGLDVIPLFWSGLGE